MKTLIIPNMCVKPHIADFYYLISLYVTTQVILETFAFHEPQSAVRVLVGNST